MEDQIYIIIAKVLQGEASAPEQLELDEWLAADVRNADVLAEMKAVWVDADKVITTGPQFDTTSAWKNVSARMQIAEDLTAPKRGRTIAFPAWARVSSAVAALLIIALFVWNPFSEDMVRIATTDASMRVELPDQSIITLRKGSSFSYPKKFEGKERKVSLEGEAFFEVARNEQQPFVIDAQQVSVKVLGTTFNVRCNKNVADVMVASGRVQVAAQANANNSVVLTPGNKVHYEGGRFIQDMSTGYEAAWRQDSLSFNGIQLSNVIAAIAAARDTAVAFDATVTAQQQQQAITVSFSKESLEDMLTELCLISHCSWKKTGNTYLISSK